MQLAPAPEEVLINLIRNAELLSLGMNNDAVERQSANLRS